jgi:hypothetical protein
MQSQLNQFMHTEIKQGFLSQLLCELLTLRIVERTKFTIIIDRNRKDSLRQDAKRATE